MPRIPGLKLCLSAIVYSLLINQGFAALVSFNKSATTADIKIRMGNSKEENLYKTSIALVIGVSNYTNGWTPLAAVRDDVAAVSEALTEQGFRVNQLLDPTIETFKQELQRFFTEYGNDKENRLLLYYSGHSITLENNNRDFSFLVPSDAPLPNDKSGEFKKRAVSLNDIGVWATNCIAKHALFVIDSPVSGALFQKMRGSNRGDIKLAGDIFRKASSPVRQFIVSASSSENVPDISIFRRQFVRGLRGDGDQNKDGYITGTELGAYLVDTVMQLTQGKQRPVFGNMGIPDFDHGDFIFALPKAKPLQVPKKSEENKEEKQANPADLALWQEIDKDNADNLALYLRVFPTGHFANVAAERVTILREQLRFAMDSTARGARVTRPNIKPTISRTGKDYAILIATEKYDEWKGLDNPVIDANRVGKELKELYGFEVELIFNKKLDDIFNALEEYGNKTYAEDDQLLIFIGGHGAFNEKTKEGFIVAKDSKRDDRHYTSYLPHSRLANIIDSIPCKHIFVILDVCFGGTFDQTIAKAKQRDVYDEATNVEVIQRKLKYKSRLYLTSGGKEYVPDGRPGQHSPFVRSLLNAITGGGTNGIVTLNYILSKVEHIKPEPRAGDFGSNEPGSSFIFILKAP